MKMSRFTPGLAVMLTFSTLSFASDDAITLPAGSELHVQLITTLSSKTSETGDMWTGKVVELGDLVILPVDAAPHQPITRSYSMKRPGSMRPMR